MRRIFVAVLIVATILVNSFSREAAFSGTETQRQATNRASSASAKDNAEQAIRQVEAERIKAMLSNDIKTLERILADDLVYTHSTALVDTKAKWIENIKTGEVKYEVFEPDDVKVRVYDNAAVMTGRAKVKTRTKNGQETSALLRFTSVYVNRQGRWQFASWQSTRITQ